MENYIIESLNNLGYTGPETELPRLELLLAEEPDSTVALSKLVHFLSEKLCSVSDIEERVNVINSPDEIEMMCMELSGLLRELYCPYSALMEGPHRKRLSSRSNRLKLLNFLATECEAAAMISTDERQKKMAKTIDESPTAKNLKSTLMTLGFSKPPSDLSAQQLFKKTNEKVQQILKQQSSAFLEEPLLKLALTENQWCKLRELHAELSRDYKLRREMLLTRLDVTFLSFTWSANLKTKLDQVSAIYQPLRSKLTSEPHVRISHILSARYARYYSDLKFALKLFDYPTENRWDSSKKPAALQCEKRLRLRYRN